MIKQLDAALILNSTSVIKTVFRFGLERYLAGACLKSGGINIIVRYCEPATYKSFTDDLCAMLQIYNAFRFSTTIESDGTIVHTLVSAAIVS